MTPERFIAQIAAYYALDSPTATFRYIDGDGCVHTAARRDQVPASEPSASTQWRSMPAAAYDAVLWRVPFDWDSKRPRIRPPARVIHNGLAIQRPFAPRQQGYRWKLRELEEALSCPDVAVFDTRQSFALNLERYELPSPALPFETDLLTSIGRDILAYYIAGWERQYPLAEGWILRPIVGRERWFPLVGHLAARHATGPVCAMWVDWLAAGEKEEALETAFLAPHQPDEQWRKWPLRTALPVPDVDRPFGDDEDDDEDDYAEASPRGLRPLAVSAAMARLDKALGHALSVGVLIDWSPAGEIEADVRWIVGDSRWHWGSLNKGSAPFFAAADPEGLPDRSTRKRLHELTMLGLGVLERAGGGAIALSVSEPQQDRA